MSDQATMRKTPQGTTMPAATPPTTMPTKSTATVKTPAAFMKVEERENAERKKRNGTLPREENGNNVNNDNDACRNDSAGSSHA
mmetsp:Transcript_32655/g.68494  ORF Transcript_32655/g.68494 Transcript_32655/m.68494 type:complete len:84 (+) Transcript_32655:190-441(+)